MNSLTAFQRDILVCIAAHDRPYGLQIKSDLETYRSEEINHGRLYPNLDQLKSAGLIRKGTIDKRTNFYELTDEGIEHIDEHLSWIMEKLASTTGVAPEEITAVDIDTETTENEEPISDSASA